MFPSLMRGRHADKKLRVIYPFDTKEKEKKKETKKKKEKKRLIDEATKTEIYTTICVLFLVFISNHEPNRKCTATDTAGTWG